MPRLRTIVIVLMMRSRHSKKRVWTPRIRIMNPLATTKGRIRRTRTRIRMDHPLLCAVQDFIFEDNPIPIQGTSRYIKKPHYYLFDVKEEERRRQTLLLRPKHILFGYRQYRLLQLRSILLIP